MKTDVSRLTFDPANHYSAVLHEQGKLVTDADLEEEHRILAHRIETEAADLVGGCGGPIAAAGFALSASDGALTIGVGRYYVDGILVANEADVAFVDQPDRVEPALPSDAGSYIAYLEVWRRLITALDDPSIREVAFGGPTTSAREATVWQVRLVQADETSPTCLTPLPDLGGTTGRMAAQADPEASDVDPCEVPPTAGFKGLENQLYRVEVHAGGHPVDLSDGESVRIQSFGADATNVIIVASEDAPSVGDAVEIFRTADGTDRSDSRLAHVIDVAENGSTAAITLDRPVDGYSLSQAPALQVVDATFVWSRNNGSVVTSIQAIDGPEVTVADIGPDSALGFGPGQWVEITDDGHDLEGAPGQLTRVQAVDPARGVVTLTSAAGALDDGSPTGVDPDRHPKLRRWDGAGGIRRHSLTPDADWIHLEHGVQVRFDAGRYRTGDYWQAAARTAAVDPQSGGLEWPTDPTSGDPQLLDPAGVQRHVCKLAVVDLENGEDGEPVVGDITDCRTLFPAVTELTTLLYVGGDGQEGLPDPTQPDAAVPLPGPLTVRVANGEHPVEGARVQFTVHGGNGDVVDDQPVPTDNDGIATCTWTLDATSDHQICEARLLDAAGNPINNQVVRFSATLSEADRVAYDPASCPDLKEARAVTVQKAIDALCARPSGGSGCCVTVGPSGEHRDVATAVGKLVASGQRRICLCLDPDVIHHLDDPDLPSRRDTGPLHVTIRGAGPRARVDLRRGIRAIGLASFALEGLDIATARNAILTADCGEVTIRDCFVSGLTSDQGVVRIQRVGRATVADCTLEAHSRTDYGEFLGSFELYIGLERRLDLSILSPWRQFDDGARSAAAGLASGNLDRDEMADFLRELIQALSGSESLSEGERRALLRLASALHVDDTPGEAFYMILIAIRRSLIRADTEIAAAALELDGLVFDDVGLHASAAREGPITIKNNDIAGLVRLHGSKPEGEIRIHATWKDLKNLADENRLPLSGAGARVHVTGNRLTRFSVGAEFAEAVASLVEAQQKIPVAGSLHVTDNVIDGHHSALVGYNTTMTSNDFSLASIVRPSEVNDNNPLLVVVGNCATYVGNVHPDTAGTAMIASATRRGTEAGNLIVVT